MGSFFTSATLAYGDIDVDCLSFVMSLSSGVHHCAANKASESGFCLASDVMDRLLRRTGGNLAVMHLDVLCTVQELPGDAGLQISPVYAPNPGKCPLIFLQLNSVTFPLIAFMSNVEIECSYVHVHLEQKACWDMCICASPCRQINGGCGADYRFPDV